MLDLMFFLQFKTYVTVMQNGLAKPSKMLF